MKKYILSLGLGLVISTLFSQEAQMGKDKGSYNIFDCFECNKNIFIATNSGVNATPIGFRLGFLCKTGAYLGARFGKGEVYHSMQDSISNSKLFSVTGGLIKPIFIKGDFSLHAFAGAGYAQWWDYRWDTWTKEGTELEVGIMTSYNNIMFNLSANRLNGYKTYATWDFTVGVGYRF
jgi:hypothetical protein